MVGKSFTQLAALLFVEWRSKVRPSPSETSKRRPRAPLEIVVVLPPLSRFGGKATRALDGASLRTSD
jgi:hypothetical protein